MFAIWEWISQADNEASTAQSWMVASLFIVENKEIFSMVSCFYISTEVSHKVLVYKGHRKYILRNIKCLFYLWFICEHIWQTKLAS